MTTASRGGGGSKSSVVKTCTPSEAGRLADGWTDEILACRSGLVRHNFEPYTAVFSEKYKYWSCVVRCARCGARKIMEVNNRGQLITKPHINYPPGYLAKGKGRILGDAADVVRAIAIDRIFVNKSSVKPKDDIEPRPSVVSRLKSV